MVLECVDEGRCDYSKVSVLTKKYFEQMASQNFNEQVIYDIVLSCKPIYIANINRTAKLNYQLPAKQRSLTCATNCLKYFGRLHMFRKYHCPVISLTENVISLGIRHVKPCSYSNNTTVST